MWRDLVRRSNDESGNWTYEQYSRSRPQSGKDWCGSKEATTRRHEGSNIQHPVWMWFSVHWRDRSISQDKTNGTPAGSMKQEQKQWNSITHNDNAPHYQVGRFQGLVHWDPQDQEEGQRSITDTENPEQHELRQWLPIGQCMVSLFSITNLSSSHL